MVAAGDELSGRIDLGNSNQGSADL